MCTLRFSICLLPSKTKLCYTTVHASPFDLLGEITDHTMHTNFLHHSHTANLAGTCLEPVDMPVSLDLQDDPAHSLHTVSCSLPCALLPCSTLLLAY